ncbi:MAG: hypothetical protein IAE87_19430 [Rhodobacteraceae bacterium]|jgi:hypothetical protein|nr:hypothetical protein [Paracoccaceae bacterium]
MCRLALICLIVLAAPALAEEDPPRALPGAVACPAGLPAGHDWSEAERGAWDRICRGDPAEMDLADPKPADAAGPLPCNPERIAGEVPANRRLSADFLTLILTREPYVSIAARPEVYIYCADVTGSLNLRNEDVSVAFGLFESRATEEVTLYSASFARSLLFNGSTLAGGLVGDGLSVGGDLGLRNGTEVRQTLRLMGARIGGDLTISGGSDLAVGLLADRADIGGSVFLGGSRFHGDLRLIGAKVGGNIEANDGIVVTGELAMDRISVAGNVFLGTGGHYGGDIRLVDAGIGQNLQISGGADVAGTLQADRAAMGGSLGISGSGPFRGDVQLGRATIGSDLSIDGSTFEKRLIVEGAQIAGSALLGYGSRFAGQVRLLGVSVGTNLSLTNDARFESDVWADNIEIGGNLFLNLNSRFAAGLELPNARIEGMAVLGNSAFDGAVRFDNARIGQVLMLSAPNAPLPVWGSAARLSLRNAAMAALQADMGAWHRPDGSWLPTELTGLTYDRLGGERASDPAAGPNMADASITDLLDWIEKSQPDQRLHYDPQPYAQLAAVLEAQGGTRAADAVRYARTEHRRTAASTPYGESLLLFFSRIFIGYGVYPFRALWWFLALVVAGIAVARFSDAPQLARPMSRFWYSVETAFPLMDPSSSLADVNHGRRWVEQYFHFQKVAGFILATILVGSLTLLGG